MRNNRKKFKFRTLIKEYVKANKKEYCIGCILFIIGIFIGVMFINNAKDNQLTSINEYISKSIEKIKSIKQLNNFEILKDAIFKNCILAIAMWFFGTTIVRDSNCVWNYCI